MELFWSNSKIVLNYRFFCVFVKCSGKMRFIPLSLIYKGATQSTQSELNSHEKTTLISLLAPENWMISCLTDHSVINGPIAPGVVPPRANAKKNMSNEERVAVYQYLLAASNDGRQKKGLSPLRLPSTATRPGQLARSGSKDATASLLAPRSLTCLLK